MVSDNLRKLLLSALQKAEGEAKEDIRKALDELNILEWQQWQTPKKSSCLHCKSCLLKEFGW